MNLLHTILSSGSFLPHGHCYLWKPAILWAQILSNGSIGIAYVAIASMLAYLVNRGSYLPFKGMGLAFGAFIVTCGITHFFDVLVIWHPLYWLDSGVRIVTAAASVGTAIMLPPLIPRALTLARGAEAARRRGVELEAVVEDLESLYERTKQADELKTEFFANVSHELRTPLALIIGPAEKLLGAANLSAEQRRDAEVLLRNARTLKKHVDDLLDVAKLEAGRQGLRYARADAAELLRAVAAHFEGLADERGMRYTVEAPASLHAELDVDKTRRVVLNLVANAFKFTGAGGAVRCALRGSDAEIVIDVADSGPGVPPEQRALIFERFHQAESSAARRFGGTGLGLAIARDFVELQRGRLEVRDAPEGGALFRVVLPRRAPADIDVEAQAGASEAFAGDARQALAELRTLGAAPRTEASAEGPLALVVEDNADMNRFVAETLAPDYRVQQAFDGRRGLELAERLAPDLIVSDLMMPEHTGEELVAAIRKRPALDAVPILLLTAKTEEDTRVRLLRTGAQDYLTKPFSADELRARAANLVVVKRVRDVLQGEISARYEDLERLAREVTHRQRELRTALEAARVAREQAERASRIKSDFLGLISHELRSPLAVLQLQVERLELGGAGLSDEAAGVLARMRRSTRQLGELIESLLQHARLRGGPLDPALAPVDAAALAHDVIDELRERAAEKGIALELRVVEPLPALATDRALVRVVIWNLVANGVKFTKEGGVTLEVDAGGDTHRFVVADTGRGMSAAEQARVFEPFESAESMRNKHTPGLGLGLALVRDLVSAIGGTLELESAPGRGSRFTVTLPSVSKEGAAASRPNAPARGSEP